MLRVLTPSSQNFGNVQDGLRWHTRTQESIEFQRAVRILQTHAGLPPQKGRSHNQDLLQIHREKREWEEYFGHTLCSPHHNAVCDNEAYEHRKGFGDVIKIGA